LPLHHGEKRQKVDKTRNKRDETALSGKDRPGRVCGVKKDEKGTKGLTLWHGLGRRVSK